MICLESPEISNKYLRRVPVKGQGLISIPGFFYFWGILFMVFNTLIVLLQHEENSKLDLHLHQWIKCLCNKFKSKSNRLTSPNSCQMIITDKLSDVISNKSYNEMHNSTEMNAETLNTEGVQREISYYSDIKTLPEPNENEVKERRNLSLIGTYKVILGVMQLKVVWMYLLLITISKNVQNFQISLSHDNFSSYGIFRLVHNLLMQSRRFKITMLDPLSGQISIISRLFNGSLNCLYALLISFVVVGMVLLSIDSCSAV
ncbi:unnamed protein product [Trichobilharzia regenti]|nr:unnamed protein product [Trichobilharzia regenti]